MITEISDWNGIQTDINEHLHLHLTFTQISLNTDMRHDKCITKIQHVD